MTGRAGLRAICWWAADRMSRLLHPDERDAVHGDLTESGVTAGQALRDVLGLVVRRQAALWMHWRPWLALVVVVAPLGALLSLISGWWADWSAIYAWLYVNNWTWTYLASPGARFDLLNFSAQFLTLCITMAGWSWTAGFVLGSLSRRSVWVVGTLFCLAVVAVTPWSAAGRANPFNNAVFAVPFYRVVFPSLMRAVLVLIPALCGMRRSLEPTELPLVRTMAWAVAIAMLTAWTAKGLEASVTFGWHIVRPQPGPDGIVGTLDDPRPLRLLPLVMVWPVVYMVATGGWRRWRSHGVSPSPQ